MTVFQTHTINCIIDLKKHTMGNELSKGLLLIRDRIERRSIQKRLQYLSRLPKAPSARNTLGCANLAHTTAAMPTPQRHMIATAKAPHIGIITAYNDMLSAHQPFERYPDIIRQHAHTHGATVQVAGGTPAMCDGVTQGREGMELSLFSRDVIALSACIGLSHDVFDGVVLLGVCDKIAPGLLIGALGFGHLPAVFIPAGPMSSGLSNSEKAKVRQLAAQGKADRATLLKAEEQAYHSPGTCTFYGTANSNQLLLDCMGLQFPGGAFELPGSSQRSLLIEHSVRSLVTHCKQPHLRLGELVNVSSIMNALVGLMASGGSTNHTIHWIAVARAAGILIDWDDLQDISAITPLLTRIYPNGTEDVNSFHAAGGTAVLISTLINAGLIDGSIPTIWGGTLAEVVGEVTPGRETFSVNRVTESRNTDVLRPHSNPFQSDGGIRLLKGNLGRAVCKISAVPSHLHTVRAPCRVFSDQQAVLDAFAQGALSRDVVVVVRKQGPRANGMPELHKLTPVLGVLQDQGYKVALLTDGRMSGASGKVLAAIHVTPESFQEGPISRLNDGDVIEIDATQGVLNTSADLSPRTACPTQNDGGHTLGRQYFESWRKQVSGAEQGASTLFDW